MNEPTWTTTLPTVSGWYWLKHCDDRTDLAWGWSSSLDLELTDAYAVYFDAELGAVWNAGCEFSWPIAEYDGGDYQWSGSIKPPAREDA